MRFGIVVAFLAALFVQPAAAAPVVYDVSATVTRAEYDPFFGESYYGPYNIGAIFNFEPTEPYDVVPDPLSAFSYACITADVSGSAVTIRSQCWPSYGNLYITLNFDHDLGGLLPLTTDGYLSGSWSESYGGGMYSTGIDGPVTRLGISAPEPASWALMLFGFGTLGFVMRRRSTSARELEMARQA